MTNRLTDMLGIRYPIVQGGMQWVGYAEMAAAVSNAGGLGTLTALSQPDPDALSKEIARTREMPDAPFAVNLTVLPSINPPPYAEYVDAIVESGVKIVETAGQSPREFVETFKANDIRILHKCTQVRHALSAQKSGVDVISIDGFECAGHPGEKDIPNLLLVPLAVRALDIPVIASGGIGEGRGLAAAMAMGADGINMGTRFCATKEAPIHENIKRALVEATEHDTRLIFRTMNNTARVLANAISDEVVATERREGGCEFEEIRHLVAGQRGKAALEAGEVDNGVITAGPVIGLIDDIPSCAELIERMMEEARRHLRDGLAALG